LDFPANVQVMSLLRAEPKGFGERRVPREFAGSLNCAPVLVAISGGSGRGESGGVEKIERRPSANACVRIADLLCAERKTRSCSIVGRSATEVSRNRRSSLPSYDVLKPPIAENMFGPSAVSIAMALAEGQFVHGEKAGLMPDIK
jgi:hypothetical protein